LDGAGEESAFTASLGFRTPSESVFAESQLLFSQLGGSDINDWLSTVYDDLARQLPAAYQPRLSLDLVNDVISFSYPTEDMLDGGFISNGTTDINASSSLQISTEVPGPLPIFGVGAAYGYSRRLRQRIKRTKTPEVISAIG
jgi:hypothetical protein